MMTIDSDAHVIECEKTWTYVEISAQALMPRLVTESDGDGSPKQYWVLEGRAHGRANIGLTTTSRESREMADVDARLTSDVQLHCCGGFVLTTRYGFARTTADLDVLSIVPIAEQQKLAAVAGRGSELHKTHGIYLDIVTVAS